MLGDPKRLRTPRGHGYLVSWKDRLRLQGDGAAAELVERILADAGNVESLRAGSGRPEASVDELAAWLTTGLAGGGLQLLKTRVEPPVMDRPPETDLFDLLPPQEPTRELESLTFEVVDAGGEGVPVHYQIYAPNGDPSGSLPSGERHLVAELEPNANVEVELSAIVLPFRDGTQPTVPVDPSQRPQPPSGLNLPAPHRTPRDPPAATLPPTRRPLLGGVHRPSSPGSELAWWTR